jgi:peroxiredoxin Q/BCP
MAHRNIQRQAAREQRLQAEAEERLRRRHRRVTRYATGGVIAAIAVVLIVVAVTLGGSSAKGNNTAATGGGMTASGLKLGAAAPNFKLTDAVSGKQMTLASLRGHETLLFFSEGVSCQPCLIQAADLQRSGLLARAGIKLVSVTTDTAPELATAAKEYGITAPLLADPSTSMSSAYGMLAQGGMHMAGEDGHAFMLISAAGKVLWRRAFSTMYVAPKQLMADMHGAMAAPPSSGAVGS